MRSVALTLCAIIAGYLFVSSLQNALTSEVCTLVITGESIRITGCNLSPAHFRAISHLKVLQVRL
uniref:Movement protein TGBp3 n=1 Tax=Lily symptomless virus TaxID=12173 RepID=A0A0P0ZEC9_LSV|nr:triple gene block protein 3 [Lily symptomless virus]